MCGRSCFAGWCCSCSVSSCFLLEVFVLDLSATKEKGDCQFKGNFVFCHLIAGILGAVCSHCMKINHKPF